MTSAAPHHAAAPAPAASSPRPGTRRGTVVGLAALALVAAAAAWTPSAAADAAVDSALAAAGAWLARAVSALSWPVLLGLAAAAGLHYVAAAVCARAACRAPLPFGELVVAQFAASTANRLTPAGLGGATVLGRYFIRRGNLRAAESAATISVLAVIGSLADVLVFALLLGVATVGGAAGASGEVSLLVSRLTGLVPMPGSSWAWSAAGGAVTVVLVLWAFRSRAVAVARRIETTARRYAHAIHDLARQPRRLATVVAASGCTTMALAAGFAFTATAGSGLLPVASFAAVMIGYMVAAAAGNALPTPGGIGAAETTLVGVLVADRMPAANAVAIVLAFRLVTFWSPAVIGAAAMRWLRMRGAL